MKIFRKLSDWLGDIKPARGDDVRFDLTLGELQVAELVCEAGEWVFRYSQSFRSQSEIQPIVGFSRVDQEYRSEDLWPFFAIRVPSLSQPAVKDFMARNDLDEVDEVTMLKKFGEHSISNPFRLVATAA